MNNALYSLVQDVTYSDITRQNPVISVRCELEAVLREAAVARDRLSSAQQMIERALDVSPEARAEYVTARRRSYVAEERRKNVVGRIISFGLLSFDDVHRMSKPYGY